MAIHVCEKSRIAVAYGLVLTCLRSAFLSLAFIQKRTKAFLRYVTRSPLGHAFPGHYVGLRLGQVDLLVVALLSHSFGDRAAPAGAVD